MRDHVGYLYRRDRPVKEDAASIRRTVKTLSKAGLLPADWKFSVRYRSFAGGCAIDVTASAPRPIYAVDPTADAGGVHAETGEWVWAWRERLTVEAAAVDATLSELVAAHNHDRSDISTDYFDVKFYGSVTVEQAGHRFSPEWISGENTPA